MNPVARDLISAFKSSEKPETVAALIVDDGFDAATIRVLTAWMNADHDWKAPARPCPDAAKPTAKAWAWLIAGMRVDYVAIADAADVASSVAQKKLALLLGNRLVYPDGTISKAATAALQAAVRARVKSPRGESKPPKQSESN